MNSLKIKSDDGAQTMEGEFGPSGLLFLISSPGGPSLSNEIMAGQIAYMAFSQNGRNIFGTPLHQAASIDSGAKTLAIAPGMAISIGLKTLRIEGRQRGKFRGRRSPIVFATLAAAIIAGGLFSARNGAIAPAAPIAELKKTENTIPSAGKYLDEARGFLREGDIRQARLVLMAAAENFPGDDRAGKLIAEIDREGEKNFPKEEKKIDPRADEALVFFKDGQDLERSGDRLGAKKSFDRAMEIARRLQTAPTFLTAIEEALKQSAIKIDEEIRPKLSLIRAKIDSTALLPAVDAAKIIREARSELSPIIGAMPKDGDAAALGFHLDGAARTIASRWISSARTAERLSGCAKAVSMYEAISAGLKDVEPMTAREAGDSASHCRGNAP